MPEELKFVDVRPIENITGGKLITFPLLNGSLEGADCDRFIDGLKRLLPSLNDSRCIVQLERIERVGDKIWTPYKEFCAQVRLVGRGSVVLYSPDQAVMASVFQNKVHKEVQVARTMDDAMTVVTSCFLEVRMRCYSSPTIYLIRPSFPKGDNLRESAVTSVLDFCGQDLSRFGKCWSDLIVDWQQCSLVNSGLLDYCLSMATSLKKRSRSVVFCGIPATLQDAFINLKEVVRFARDEDEALKMLRVV